MEVAIINWKTIDSSFVKDDLYENINAPKWVDLNSSQDSVDDEAWFCRPDCKHPKTVEDFYKEMATLKLQRSVSVSEILPLGNRNKRDATLKKRGFIPASLSSNKDSKCDTVVKDSENQNPNFSTTPNHKANKFRKEAVKSSAEKKLGDKFLLKEQAAPRLRSTLSARNLFAGKDILNQITEFCNELKKLATRANDRENVEKENTNNPVKTQEVKDCAGENPRDMNEREERKPLLAVSKEKCETMAKSSVKEKQWRKKRIDELENTPISVDLKNIKGKGLSQIRTVPPSPQCFSASRDPAKATPPKAFSSRPQERAKLQELEQSKEVRKEVDNTDSNQLSVSGVGETEARTLDVFWFLKPCTLSS